MRGFTAILVLCSAAFVSAEIPPIIETDNVTFRVGGYARSFTAGVVPIKGDSIGLQGTILRPEWALSIAQQVRLDVHNRFSWLILSDPVPGVEGAGIGTSIPPARSLNLSSNIIDRPTQVLNHDLDRVVLRAFLGPVDVAVGRQAVTWGVASLFPVADLWTTFSPFDLDTSQKRGIDAIRLTTGVGTWLDLDFIVADRGSVEDLSGGLLATFYTSVADVYVAVAKLWEEVSLMAGLSAEVGSTKLRLESLGAWDLDNSDFQLPRITMGVDWFANADWTLVVEAHMNGLGASETVDYIEHLLTSEHLQRGESYLFGRYYAGAALSYRPHDLVTLSLSSLTNLTDPSAMLIWNVTYSLAESVDMGLGGFHGLGNRVTEFGMRGDVAYLQLAAFF